MTAPVGKGDWVRCVIAGLDPWDKPVPIYVGEVYRIAWVWDNLPHGQLGELWTSMAFDLEGVPSMIGPDGAEYAYGAYRFKPLDGEPDAIERAEQSPEKVTA